MSPYLINFIVAPLWAIVYSMPEVSTLIHYLALFMMVQHLTFGLGYAVGYLGQDPLEKLYTQRNK